MKKTVVLFALISSFANAQQVNRPFFIEEATARVADIESNRVRATFQLCLRDTFTGQRIESAPVTIENLASEERIQAMTDEQGCVRWQSDLTVKPERTAKVFSLTRGQGKELNIAFILKTQDATQENFVQSILLEK